MDQPNDAPAPPPLSGLASLRQVFAARALPRGIARTLGLSGVEADEGRVVLAGSPTEDYYNPLGSVHGGYIATLLDSAIALAVFTTLPPGAGYTTTDLKITFLRALTKESGPLRAEGVVLHGGRRLALGEARLTDREGRLCAHATASCLVLEPAASRA